MQERCLVLCPLGHPKHGLTLRGLAVSFRKCYAVTNNIADLNRAIEIGEQAVSLCPTDGSAYCAALNSHSVAVSACYQKQGDLTDLNRAIELQEECIMLYSSSHPVYGTVLLQLALSLTDHYKTIKDHSDLIKAIELLKEALNAYSAQHNHFALIACHLAGTILLPYKSSHPCYSSDLPSFPSLNEAFQIYGLLKKSGPAASLNLWNTTKDWVQDAENYSHPSVLEAYQTITQHIGSLHFPQLITRFKT